jgi:hypothetical protein
VNADNYDGLFIPGGRGPEYIRFRIHSKHSNHRLLFFSKLKYECLVNSFSDWILKFWILYENSMNRRNQLHLFVMVLKYFSLHKHFILILILSLSV